MPGLLLGINPWLKPKGKYDASAAPTVNEDALDGFSKGSVYVDDVADDAFMCMDSTAGAAVWKPLTYVTSAGVPDPFTPPGDSDWDVIGSISATVDISAASFTGGSMALTYAGADDALAITLATDTTAQGLVISEDDVNRVTPQVYLFREASATADVMLVDNHGSGQGIQVTQAGTGAGFLAKLDGTGEGYGLYIYETAVARANPLVYIERDDLATGPMIDLVPGAATVAGIRLHGGILDFSLDGLGAAAVGETIRQDADNQINIYCNGAERVRITSSGIQTLDNIGFLFGAGGYSSLEWETTNNAVDTLVWALGTNSRGLIFCEVGDQNYNWAHLQQTNPTLWVQSANQSAVEWLSIAYGVISTGAGNLLLSPASGITSVGTGDISGTRGWRCDLSGDAGEYIYSTADNILKLVAGGAERLRVTSTSVLMLKPATVSLQLIGETTADADAGLLVESSTAATDGVQEFSPLSVIEGQGWDDTGAQTTVEVQYASQVQPVQVGAAICTSKLNFYSNIDDAGFALVATIDSIGDIIAANGCQGAGGYCIEGPSAARSKMRVLVLRITGSATDVTYEVIESVMDSETVASEQVTKGGGGTRFELSGDGLVGTIKGLSQNVSNVINHDLHKNDTAVAGGYIVHAWGDSNYMDFEVRGGISGIVLDQSAIVNGKVVEVMITYLTTT